MIPFLPEDFKYSPESWNVKWPLEWDRLAKYIGRIEAMFSLPVGRYECPEVMKPLRSEELNFIPRLAKWPAFSRRNVATLLRKPLSSRSGPAVWLNATVTKIHVGPNGLATGVSARGVAGGALEISAPEVVVAAGAIESTRLLLLTDRLHEGRIFSNDDILGRYMHDHLSASTARMIVADKASLNKVVGFRFDSSGMRNLRFEPRCRLRMNEGLPTGFAHIGFSTSGASGFIALRSLYRLLQSRQWPSVSDIVRTAAVAPWLARAMWWRLINRRLLFPGDASFSLVMVVEQEPIPENRIGLVTDRLDRFDCPLAAIDWSVGDRNVRNAMALTSRFVEAWEASSLAPLGRFELCSESEVRAAMLVGGGIYHPGGTARMGSDASSGVVDKDLRAFRLRNVSVLSTAAFPTGGGANPTMMLLLAALRMAEELR
jgi:choline dehydrogenase-like flavoprotein